MITETSRERLLEIGLSPPSRLFFVSAFLIANRNSWERKALDGVLSSLCGAEVVEHRQTPVIREIAGSFPLAAGVGKAVWLALPDGHQQPPAMRLLSEAGLAREDYLQSGNRRPSIELAGVKAKVIRPQDMPLHVANGSFDLALGGQDWLREHLCQFPSSPVREVLNLGFGVVKVVVVVSQDLPADDVPGLRRLIAAGQLRPLRVASEYVNLADRYAGDNHMGPYRVIPTWGASEAFLPEDADLLIENTQTGQTLARHNLKIIDTLFESAACLIGNVEFMSQPARRGKITEIIEILRRTLGER